MTGQSEPPYIPLLSVGFDDPEEGDPEGELAWYSSEGVSTETLKAALYAQDRIMCALGLSKKN